MRQEAVAVLFAGALIGAWAGAAAFASPYLLPGPLDVAKSLSEFAADGLMWGHVATSFAHIVLSVILSVTLGSALALLAHYAPAFRLLVHGCISPFLNSFAGIAWILMAILWFGVTSVTVVFAVSMVLLPFAIINMRVGLESIDAELVEMVRTFRRGRLAELRKVTAPALLPYLFATVRICFGVSWKIALTAELFGGNAGFGFLFNLARQQYDTPLVFVIIMLIIAFVYGIDRFIFRRLESYFGKHYALAA